ncbi:hypothetical protein GPJ56_005533 [Histomonas meleagridis]|uniref:uncharacterized protein n=1 Tax=Histomonas meleagridis TaxID=135588 RepID=UPI00355A16BC|nr:hypothetical protein GPJ56_005533 [Histomonas meleagridis]KAH0799585.1 hypothetical protein GO595_007653 [Histomonas meleagridis]
MIPKEPNAQLQRAICDVIDVFATIVIQYSTWPELPIFCFNLILHSNFNATGLYLLNCIYQALPDEEQQKYFVEYGNITTTAIVSEDIDMRIQGIKALDTITPLIVNPDDIIQIPNLVASLTTAAQTAVYKTQDGNECALLFGTLSDVLFDRFPVLIEVSPSFCDFALSLTDNKAIPLTIRICVQQILDDAPKFIPNYFEAHLQEFIQRTITLSIEACSLEREMNTYMFPQRFFEVLSSNVDQYLCYEVVIQCVASLIKANNPIILQVAIYVLSCFIENCSDALADSPTDVINLALSGLDSNDILVSLSAAELIIQISQYASACISSNLDNFVRILIPKMIQYNFLEALNSILINSEQVTIYLQQLIECCVQLLSSNFEFKEEVIECIINSLTNCDINEELYSVIAPTLINLMIQDNSLIEVIYQCFGVLSNTSPRSIINNLNEITQIMFNSGISQLGALPALLSFIEKFPISMQPFKDQSIQLSVTVLETDFENIDEEIVSNARAASIQILSYLCPTNLHFVEILAKMIPSISNKDKQSSAIAFSNAIPMLSLHTTLDPTPFLLEYLNELPDLEEPESVMYNIETIISIISYFDPYDNKFENLASGLISGFAVLFVIGILWMLTICRIIPTTSYHFMGKDIYTLNELTEKITDIRTTPPIYKIFHEAHDVPKEFYKNAEYVTWEEYEEVVSIPTDTTICVIFESEIYWSDAMINELDGIKKENSGIFSTKVCLDANLDSLIAGNDIPFVVKLFSRRYMKVLYIILIILSCSYLMDLIFFSNCQVIIVKTSKRADIEPTYRAKAGERDLEAATYILNDGKEECP